MTAIYEKLLTSGLLIILLSKGFSVSSSHSGRLPIAYQSYEISSTHGKKKIKHCDTRAILMNGNRYD